MSFSIPFTYKTLFSLVRINASRRLYGKNVLRRRPVRVLNVPEDKITLIRDETFSPKLQQTSEIKTEDTSIGLPRNKDGLIVPPYEKLQKNDSRFTKTLTTLKNRKLREQNGKMLLEGKRLINDAIDAGIELETIYFSRDKELADIKFKFQENVEILKVFYKTLQQWSNLTTCPGIMGCVDPWEHKVLRAGCGGHFRIPIINNIEWTHISNYISKSSTIFIADNSEDIIESSSTPEFINYDEAPEENEDEEVEIKRYATMNECNQPISVDETYNDPAELEKYEELTFPCYLYSSIKFPKENIVLYVGGETHGVDARAVKLACDYGGKKVKIPLENNMESLNSCFAMTIILYEIKRQLKEQYILK
ncbi:UNVERIFIED_CONTAM: mrm3 [Trichonephila clavipes]